MTRRALLAALRSFCAGIAPLRVAPVGEIRFPLLDPFFRLRLSFRAAEFAASAEEWRRGNLTVSPKAPSLAGALGARR